MSQELLIAGFFFMPTASRPRLVSVLFGLLLALAVAAGCAPVGPDFQAPQPKLPEQWNSGQSLPLPTAQATVDRWWQLFEDPLLAQLLDEAGAANHNLKKAEANIREARAQRVIAASQGSLGAGASSSSARRSDNVSGGSQDLYQPGFDARWEIDLFGAKKRATEAADATLATSGEVRRNVLVSLHAEVARVYIELRGAQRRLATAATTITIQQQTTATVRGRLQLGFDSQLDLYQAQTQEALTRASLPSLERSARQAMHQLAVLLGQPPAALLSRLSAGPWQLHLPEQLPLELPSELLRRRPDIRAAEQRLAAATANIGVAVADLYPKFSLGGLLGLQSTNLSNLVSSASRYWSIGPNLSLTLFDRDKLHAAVDVSTARRDLAFAEYQQTVLEALGEVENGLVAFAQEQKTRGPLLEAAISARQAVEIAQGRYQAGLTEFLHVLQAEKALHNTEDLLAQSEQRLALAVVAVYKALGGGAVPSDPDSQTSPESPAAASP